MTSDRGVSCASAMVASRTEDPDCIFCRPNDDHVNAIVGRCNTMYARLDNFPAHKGHIEIVPFRHVDSFFDLTTEEIIDFYNLSKSMREYLDEKFAPDGYTIGINDGPAAGRTVPHLHVHIIPRKFGDVPDPRGGIRRMFPDCNPDSWH